MREVRDSKTKHAFYILSSGKSVRDFVQEKKKFISDFRGLIL